MDKELVTVKIVACKNNQRCVKRGCHCLDARFHLMFKNK